MQCLQGFSNVKKNVKLRMASIKENADGYNTESIILMLNIKKMLNKY